MGASRLTCKWCRAQLLAPFDSQYLNCPVCHRYISLQSDNNNSYLPYEDSGHLTVVSSNRYATNPGYAASGRLHPPGYTGRVYQLPQSPYTPPAHGRKRAVLCGITYKGHRQRLKGSINDVLLMKKLLVVKFRFPEASILLLTEEEGYARIPTKKNIRTALQWLVQGCQPGDSLVFHYSGHGSQVKDRDGDELDGYDECLLPVDYETEGRILDDELNATIVRPLPRGAMLHSIIDTCFSGTFLDLQYACRINRHGHYKWENHQVQHAAFKGTSGGSAICISACDDHQSSGDTSAFTGNAMGAFTYSFVQIVGQQPKLTYGDLLLTMSKQISLTQERMGLSSSEPHSMQEPQLSSSHKFDIHSKYFTL